MLPILAMPILVLCPQCRHRTEKTPTLTRIALRESLYRCPSCGTLCIEPTVHAIGEPVTLDDEQSDTNSQAH